MSAAVVVFPCAPPTTIERRSPTSSARNSARDRPVDSSRVRRRDDDLEPERWPGSPPMSTSMPSSASRKIVSRDVPARDLCAPRPREVRVRGEPGAPDADEVELAALRTEGVPCSPAASGQPNELVGDLVCRVEAGERLHRVAHAFAAGRDRRATRRRAQAPARARSGRRRVRRRPRAKCRAFERLVVARRVRVRHEDRRSPRRRELPHRPTGARDREIRRRQRRAECVGRREQHVVAARDARAQRRDSRARPTRAAPPGRARRTHRPRTRSAPARPRGRRRRRGPDRRLAARTAPAPPPSPHPRCAAGIGRPTTLVLAAVTPGDRVREEDAPRERRREPVRRARGARPPP